MTGLASLLAIALALVLIAAGSAKFRSPSRTTADFAALGLPAPGLLARVVPAVEIGVAAALILVPGWGGVAAFGLLALFTALLVSLVRSGQIISCSCFGAVSDEPVSWVEVTRNAVLLTMAASVTPIDRLEMPGFAAVVGASGFAVVALVLIQLAVFRRDVGVIWSTHLSGEAPAT